MGFLGLLAKEEQYFKSADGHSRAFAQRRLLGAVLARDSKNNNNGIENERSRQQYTLVDVNRVRHRHGLAFQRS